jgi:predicted lysophospholipase L1 biosynthesis ABC-type transport system permease subunit
MNPGALGNLAALLGDLIWLAADAVFEPLMHIPRWPFFWAIGACFLVAVILLLLEMRRKD